MTVATVSRASRVWWMPIAGALLLAGGLAAHLRGQAPPPSAHPVYDAIKAFTLGGDSADVAAFVLKRDRVEMTFNGTFYFTAPVEGHVTGAVFVGQGSIHVPAPPSPGDFERDNMKRLLGADVLDSDFKTAVLRMTDDTHELILKAIPPRGLGTTTPAPLPPDAQNLASKFEPRLLRDIGMNLSARLTTSIVNGETPGVFVAEFDGGKRGRFDLVLDYQSRIPSDSFDINAGEKGLVFSQSALYFTDVSMAFYALQDYEPGHITPYSDANNLIDITHYAIDVDLHTPGTKIGVTARMDATVKTAGLHAVSFKVGESLGAYQDQRLNKQLRVKNVQLGANPIAFVQEDWEGGFTVFLPAAAKAGDALPLTVSLEGNYMISDLVPECFYLASNQSWYPRHGDSNRSTFDFTYHHLKRQIVISAGSRVSEADDPARTDYAISKYQMPVPVPIAAFAVGQFERTKQMSSSELGGQKIPLEFSAFSQHSNNTRPIRSDSILGEMDNAVRYLSAVFGAYPYPVLTGVLQPYAFGQGFPSVLFLAPADTGDYRSFSFIAHETSHQWWGGVIAWRSYRDQWLSEGFAEYSGILYTGKRDKPEWSNKLIYNAREALKQSPRTTTGVLKGRLADIGPMILGHRLDTSQSQGAYQALIYSKGALVLRMLHFLLLSNLNGGDAADAPFQKMMTAFVDKYRNGTATTEQFIQVADEAFAQSPLAQKHQLPSLKAWFAPQWIYTSAFPTYTLDYELQPQADGTCLVVGSVLQDNVPDTWVMPLPVVFSLAEKKMARTTVLAKGASSKFQLKLPSKPVKVELDPDSWVLSDKTITKGKG